MDSVAESGSNFPVVFDADRLIDPSVKLGGEATIVVDWEPVGWVGSDSSQAMGGQRDAFAEELGGESAIERFFVGVTPEHARIFVDDDPKELIFGDFYFDFDVDPSLLSRRDLEGNRSKRIAPIEAGERFA